MIYTVTFNPSIDYVVFCDAVNKGKLNRSKREVIQYGGKGINVSVVLKNLGVKSNCLGFVGGFVGAELERGLKELGCKPQFIHLEGENTRINVKLKERDGTETEINGAGPRINGKEVCRLFEQLSNLEQGDCLVLSGNVPGSISKLIYREIAHQMNEKNVDFIVDAEKDLLVSTLEYRPMLIKPNVFELSNILEQEVTTQEDIIKGAHKLHDMGAKNVLVSRGAEGALMVDENNTVHILKAPEGRVINSVGAGDSMIAGFIKSVYSGQSLKEAFYLSVAAGSASAFSENLATRAEIDKVRCMMGE